MPKNGGVSAPTEASVGTDTDADMDASFPERDLDSGHMSGGVSSPEKDLDPGSCSDTSFETAMSQGYRTEDDEEEEQNLEISMVTLGWLNEELRSDQWVKISDQPPVRIMKTVMNEAEQTPERDRVLPETVGSPGPGDP